MQQLVWMSHQYTIMAHLFIYLFIYLLTDWHLVLSLTVPIHLGLI